jgi:hypothetical protein
MPAIEEEREDAVYDQKYLAGRMAARLPDEQLQRWSRLAKVEVSRSLASAMAHELREATIALVAEAIAERAAHDRTLEHLDFYVEREKDFAKMLPVADGGQYRADWDCAIRNLVAERDEMREKLAGLDERRAVAEADLKACMGVGKAGRGAAKVKTKKKASVR